MKKTAIPIIITCFLTLNLCYTAESSCLRLPLGISSDRVKSAKNACRFGTRLKSETAGKLVRLGKLIGKTANESKNKKSPVNVLLAGPQGSLKTTIADIITALLKKYNINVELVKTDLLSDSNDCSFNAFDKKHSDKDIIIAEAVVLFPTDGVNADLYIKLIGSLHIRQKRIYQGSGSWKYAQMRTSVDATDYKERAEDITIDTDLITIEQIDAGALEYYIGQGISESFRTAEIFSPSSIAIHQSL